MRQLRRTLSGSSPPQPPPLLPRTLSGSSSSSSEALAFLRFIPEGADSLAEQLSSVAARNDATRECALRLRAAVRAPGTLCTGSSDASVERLVARGAVKRVKRRQDLRIGAVVLWKGSHHGSAQWVASEVVEADRSYNYLLRLLLPDSTTSRPKNVNPGRGERFCCVKSFPRTFAPSQSLDSEELIALLRRYPLAVRRLEPLVSLEGEGGGDGCGVTDDDDATLLELALRPNAAQLEDCVLAAIAEASATGRELTAIYVDLIADGRLTTAAQRTARLDDFVRGGADPERLLLASALLESIPLATHLREVTDVKGTAIIQGDGRQASVVGAHSSIPEVVHFFRRFGTFLQRYVLEPRILHRSKTCLVCIATDAAHPDARSVALKLMHHRGEFTREIAMRGTIEHDEVVIGLLGWHVPADEEPVLGTTCEAAFPRAVSASASSSAEIEELGLSGLTSSSSSGQRSAPTGSSEDRAAHPLHSGFKYVLVMERGGQSILVETLTHRIAGVDANGVARLACAIVRRVAELHRRGVVHGDLKLRNVIRCGQRGWCDEPSRQCEEEPLCLCDLDASLLEGELHGPTTKISTAYAAPELQVALLRGERLKAERSLDMWSLGVILFELCTGHHLFAQDISNDNMVLLFDKARLATWRCVDDAALHAVFADEDSECSATQRDDARHLIRWCLAGHAADRPTVHEVLEHRFLSEYAPGGGGGVAPPVDSVEHHTVVDPSLFHLIGRTLATCAHSSARMRFHIFLSHTQLEASGDAAALCASLATLGLHAWRDMSQVDLTDAGMRQGVFDSDVFVLFLTNSALSRTFCLKEIAYAIEFKKPILFVRENEERFFRFDLERWHSDRCTKRADDVSTSGGGSGLGFTWEKGWLQNNFADVPTSIVQLVEEAWESYTMLPFRRRDFEVAALAREVVRRSKALHGTAWGGALPASPAHRAARCGAKRRVCILFDRSDDRAYRTSVEFVRSVDLVASATEWVEVDAAFEKIEGASHFVVLLTDGALVEGSECVRQLARVSASGARCVYLYFPSGDSFFNFSDFNARSAEGSSDFAIAARAIAGSEALKWRPPSPATKRYEHDALILEVLKRLRVVG